MMRTVAVFIFAVLFTTALSAAASSNRVQPQPLNNSFEKLVLANASSSSLRLFIPSQTSASSLERYHWEQQLNDYSQSWRTKKSRLSNEQLLKELFYDVHRQYLKQYTPYAGLQALLKTGEYNCLSATALYALLLNRLGFDYSILESINHVVLIVHISGEKFMLESTDPASGFIADADAIAARLAQMQEQEQSQGYYKFGLHVFSSISLRELAGLQYFNYAAWLFNQQQLAGAALQLDKGELLYKSERFSKVAQLLSSLQ